MNADVSSTETLLNLQGDKVLVRRPSGTHLLTFVHVCDVGSRTLRLVNKESKEHRPDWLVSQQLLDAFHPAAPNAEQAKWEVRLKS